MITTLPIGWRGRVLALGLASAVLSAVYVTLVVPLFDLYAGRETLIETRQSLLLKINAITEELPALRAHLVELRATANNDKLTLDGGSDAIASAALQGRIEDLASTNGVVIGSTESLVAPAQGHYHRIGLRLVISAPYAGLINLLGAIESARPPLIIDDLQVHAFQRRAGATPVEMLDATLQVYGFRTDEAEVAAKP